MILLHLTAIFIILEFHALNVENKNMDMLKFEIWNLYLPKKRKNVFSFSLFFFGSSFPRYIASDCICSPLRRALSGVFASSLVAEVADGSSNVREVWKLHFKWISSMKHHNVLQASSFMTRILIKVSDSILYSWSESQHFPHSDNSCQ